MTNKANLYTILGVTRNSTEQEIKTAYRKLASKHHPDKPGGNAEKFQQIQDAYDTLGDKKKRALFDNNGYREGFASGGDSSFRTRSGNSFTSEDLRNMFNTRAGGGFERSTRTKQIPKFHITLEEAYNGIHKVTPYGSVNIPKGIRSNARMYVGSDKQLVEFIVDAHSRFKRANDDLMITANVNVLDVIAGGKIRFTHLDGRTYEIKIQTGLQPGQVMKVGGKGMLNPETDQYGDLLIECNVVIPTLTRTEKDAIIAIHKPGTTEV